MKIKGLHFVSKPGNPVRHYVYAWRGGPCIMKKEGGRKPTQLGPKEIAAYHKALEDTQAVKPNTMASLIRDCRKSDEFTKLAESTRQNWGRTFDMIEDKWGTTPLTVWRDARMAEKIVKWRDTFSSQPRTADARVTVLRWLLEWGRLRKGLGINVAEKIPTLYRGGNREEIIWTPEDIEKFMAVAPQQVTDILRLARLTGFRRADLAEVEWGEVGAMAIVHIAKKKSRGRRRKATVPLTPELTALLAELKTRPRKEGVNTILVNANGKAWGPGGLGGQFKRYTMKAGIYEPGDGHDTKPKLKHLHDVRGTFATYLIMCGLTNEDAASILGWSKEQVANIRSVYVDQARIVVSIGARIAAGSVNPIVNRSEMPDEK